MRISDLFTVLREDGPRWLSWRLWYELQLRWGFVRSLPVIEDVGVPLARALKIPVGEVDAWLYNAWQEQGGAFFFEGKQKEALADLIGDKDATVDYAERILIGEFCYFSNVWRSVGNPPDWFQGVTPGTHWRSDVHWSRLPDLSPDLGDIKYVWEISRFGWVYGLARAWAATGDERYPEAFWRLTESWLDANQPEMGPHWRCAQEMALRSMAWSFGLYAFRSCISTTPNRVARLIKNMWYHACHIEKVHWYAANCVRNNHAISEAAGLFSIGTLFPFLPHAKQWQGYGAAGLARELGWQVYRDGAYVQHSMNYARFVAQICTWVIRVAAVNRVDLPNRVTESAGQLLKFLVAQQDACSGRLPNYGSNDGALILPLSSSDYLDYRPSLGALSLALGEGRLYPPGPWDEEAAWLCGPGSLGQQAPTKPEAATSTGFPEGGYYTLQGQGTSGFIRCATLRHRPAHADMLHLDVSYSGHNVLVDPGTYSYNVKPPWPAYFAGTAAHNTVTVDGRDQMRKGPRFMWLNWTRARVLEFTEWNGRVRFSGEHSAYAPICHRRTVVLDQDTYLVLDEMTGGDREHDFRLHWLLNDFEVELREDGAIVHLPTGDHRHLRIAVSGPAGGTANWARAQEGPKPRGWQSLRYGEKTPAWSMEMACKGTRAVFLTAIGPQARVDALLAKGADELISVIREERPPSEDLSHL